MINSPLNYTGNKFKLLNQIMPLLNVKSKKFIDIFAGSGLVALNSECKEILLNDSNKITIDLLHYFMNNSSDEILENMDRIIMDYNLTDTYRNGKDKYPEEKHEGLSKFNREGFNKLKKDYNANPSIDKLFALIIFGFNHYIRFNSKGEYNVPVGKVDYSDSLRKKTIEYVEAFKHKKITITCKDFRDKSLYKDKDAIYYFDPPYLITQAPYNSTWGEEDEKDLLDLLAKLDKEGYKFALSNVVEGNGKKNNLLINWSKGFNTYYLNRKYLNSNYRKKNITIAQEVLITNYEVIINE